MSEGVCRLCCKRDNVLWEVFVNVKEEISLAAKIFVCFGVKIQEDDAITKRICKSCYFFTNSAYEYRISAQQNDIKLKTSYEETVQREELIPCTISQDAFLSTLHLANKNSVNQKPKVQQYHPSVQRLKRKYPDINIPASFHRINIDPFVLLDRSDIDQGNNELTNLGFWAVNRKKFTSQTGVTLTRVRRKSVDYNESSDTSERSTPVKKKKKKKTALWCEPKSKSLRFTLKRKTKSNTTVTANKDNKTAKVPTEQSDEEYVDSSREVDSSCVADAQPRITRSTAKLADNVKKTFGEILSNTEEALAVNVASDDNDKLPNLVKVITESFHNLGSNEKHSNLDNPIISAVENVQLSDNDSTAKLKSQVQNQVKISSVQTASKQKEPDQILSTRSLLERADDIESMSSNNDGDLFMVVDQEVTTYICQTCNQVFDSLALLNNHKKYSHRSSLRCSKCSKKFAVVESLVRHEIAAHSKVQKSVSSENNGCKMSQPESNNSQMSQPENNNSQMRQPENNSSEIGQRENAISVICTTENPTKHCPSPIFEMLRETSASVAGKIENLIAKVSETNNPTSNSCDSETPNKLVPPETNMPSTIQGSNSSNSTTDINNSHSKLLARLGNQEGSQGSSQNCDASKKSDKKLLPRHIAPILKRVARKSTARHDLKRKDRETNKTQVEKDLKIEEEYVISSDDDVEIMSVVRKIPVNPDKVTINEAATKSSLDTVLDASLQAQPKQVPEMSLNETTATDNTSGVLLAKALQPQIAESESSKNAVGDAKQENVKLRDDQVLLIVESDPEDDSVMFVPNDEPVHAKVKSPGAGSSTSTKEDSANNSVKNVTNEIRQRIMMISNSPEKRAASNSSAANTNNSNNKITNEDSYINYIFNKCRYSDKVAISEQKWILKDLQMLLSRNYVPVEVVSSNVNEVSANYVVPPTSTKTNQTHAYWNYALAIKLPAKKPELPDEQPKTTVAEKRAMSSNLSPVLLNSLVAMPINSMVPVSANSIVAVSANNKVPISAYSTVPVSTYSKVPVSTYSRVPISANSKAPISKNNMVPISSNSKVSTSSGSNVSIPSTYKVPIPRSNRVTVPSTIVTVPYVNGQAAVTNSMNSFPNTNVDQNQLPNVATEKSEHINLIYIVDRTPVADNKNLALNTNAGILQLNEHNAYKTNDSNQQQKPILLNGVSYHNYAKFRYNNVEPSQPILLRQIMAPQTNVNIQNYVSVNQTNIASTSTDVQEQYISTPVIMPVNQTNPNTTCSNAPASIPPGTSNQSDLKPKEPITKPAIRIKDLSELTGKSSVNIEDRNILHGFYSNTVHNYMNNSIDNSANNGKANNTDEFMQIS